MKIPEIDINPGGDLPSRTPSVEIPDKLPDIPSGGGSSPRPPSGTPDTPRVPRL